MSIDGTAPAIAERTAAEQAAAERSAAERPATQQEAAQQAAAQQAAAERPAEAPPRAAGNIGNRPSTHRYHGTRRNSAPQSRSNSAPASNSAPQSDSAPESRYGKDENEVRHHRRPRDLPALADRLWRPPLALAVVIFAACGPAHALGHTDVVYFAVLIGLTLSAVAVPLGLLGLKREQAAA